VLPLHVKFILTTRALSVAALVVHLFQENSGVGNLPEKFPCHDVLSLGLPGTALQISLVVLASDL
jgi:hypothetical protein